MQKSLSTFRWYDNLWAALIFFTRLPFWRLYQPPKSSYAAIVEWWPLTGWITAITMAAVVYFGSMVMPVHIAVVMAITARLLLTGALHEDGLADFIDGFGGGGTDRERVLTIMKDSHIGTYGVIGLIIYFALLYNVLLLMTPRMAALAILAADPFSKMVASQLVLMMPYARTAETAKNKTVYRKPSVKAGISLSLQGLIPMAFFCWIFNEDAEWTMFIFPPCLVMYFLYLFIWRRLRGYTGDCCGAVCLLVELTFYLSVIVQSYISV